MFETLKDMKSNLNALYLKCIVYKIICGQSADRILLCNKTLLLPCGIISRRPFLSWCIYMICQGNEGKDM